LREDACSFFIELYSLRGDVYSFLIVHSSLREDVYSFSVNEESIYPFHICHEITFASGGQGGRFLKKLPPLDPPAKTFD
jgi:hypothetical protein